ncbi:unnamed protein product, partial [Citrullus colocynthis]
MPNYSIRISPSCTLETICSIVPVFYENMCFFHLYLNVIICMSVYENPTSSVRVLNNGEKGIVIVPTLTLFNAERQFRDTRVDGRVAYRADDGDDVGKDEEQNNESDDEFVFNSLESHETTTIQLENTTTQHETTTTNPQPPSKRPRARNMDYIQILDEMVSRVESTLLDVKVQLHTTPTYCVCCVG